MSAVFLYRRKRRISRQKETVPFPSADLCRTCSCKRTAGCNPFPLRGALTMRAMCSPFSPSWRPHHAARRNPFFPAVAPSPCGKVLTFFPPCCPHDAAESERQHKGRSSQRKTFLKAKTPTEISKTHDQASVDIRIHGKRSRARHRNTQAAEKYTTHH